MASPATSAQFIRLLKNDMKEVAENKYKDLQGMIPKLFNVGSSDSAWEDFFEVGRVPDATEHAGRINYTAISPGFHTKIEHKEYSNGLMFERKLMDDKKYNVLMNGAAGLMESMHRVQEKDAVKAFANVFSAAFDFMEREAGVAVCSSSHPTKSGVSTASGFDNAGTSALSKTSIDATRLLMRKFRDDIGERVEMGDDIAIVCPDALADTVRELVGTDKSYETAEGTKNMDYGRYEVIPYMRLDDYSSTNWYMVWKSQMKKDLRWLNRINPESTNTFDFETFVMKSAVYGRWSWGCLDWRWIYGHQV